MARSKPSPPDFRAALPDGTRIERDYKLDGDGRPAPYGSWYWRVYDPDRRPKRKRVNLRTSDKGAAWSKAQDYARDRALGTFDPWADAARRGATVAEAAALYLDAQRRAGRAPKTVSAAGRMLDGFARSAPAGVAVGHVEPRHVEAFVAAPKPARKGGGEPAPKSPATQARYLAVLRHFFKFCVRRGLAKTNPAVRVETPPARPNRRDHLAEHEEAALVRAIRAAETGGRSYRWLLDWLAFGVHTGLRPGEQRALRWDAVRLREGFVEVGKGHRVKTRGSVRPVELSPTAAAVLRRLDAERATEADGPVFTGPRGGPVAVDALTKRLKRFAESAGIDKTIVAYSLRHTFGTRALMAGANPAAVAGLMGTSIQIVQDHYGHYERAAGRGLIGRVFGGAPSGDYGIDVGGGEAFGGGEALGEVAESSPESGHKSGHNPGKTLRNRA